MDLIKANNSEFVFREINEGVSFFLENDLKYKFVCNTLKRNDVFNYDAYSVSYDNNDYKRNLEITITCHKDGDVFVSVVIKTFFDENENYEWLSISDYFKIKFKKDELRTFFNLNNYEGEKLKEKIISFCNNLKVLMDERLRNILLGKDWLDIPFDWSHYK